MSVVATEQDEHPKGLVVLKKRSHNALPANENQNVIDHAKSASTRLKAMAHENRLAILFHLYGGPKSVSELEVLLHMRQPAVSQQLARLRSDDMVTTERRGKQVYYSIASEDALMVVEMLQRVYSQRAAKSAV